MASFERHPATLENGIRNEKERAATNSQIGSRAVTNWHMYIDGVSLNRAESLAEGAQGRHESRPSELDSERMAATGASGTCPRPGEFGCATSAEPAGDSNRDKPANRSHEALPER
jgi:hypothetical protein